MIEVPLMRTLKRGSIPTETLKKLGFVETTLGKPPLNIDHQRQPLTNHEIILPEVIHYEVPKSNTP